MSEIVLALDFVCVCISLWYKYIYEWSGLFFLVAVYIVVMYGEPAHLKTAAGENIQELALSIHFRTCISVL